MWLYEQLLSRIIHIDNFFQLKKTEMLHHIIDETIITQFR